MSPHALSPRIARPAARPHRPAAGRRRVRFVAFGTAAALATGAIAAAGGGTAGAATPLAQSVGRFVDGRIGASTSLESVADLRDARAQAAPNTTSRNPLDADVLKAIDVPIGDALKLPGDGVLALGAANQVAVAQTNGFSYGSSGAVSNTGGAELADDSSAFPSAATVDLSSDVLESGVSTLADLPGIGTLPTIPVGTGVPALPALGGLQLTVGAVSALASTAIGGKAQTPRYRIAGAALTLESPALAALLQAVSKLFAGSALTSILGNVDLSDGVLPAACTLTSTGLGSTLTLDGGAVLVDTSTGALTIDLAKLLAALHLDLNSLPANTDLLDYLVDYLTSTAGLAAGLEGALDGVITSLEGQFSDCLTALQAGPGGLIASVVTMLEGALDTGRTAFEAAVNNLLGSASGLTGAAGDPLAPLGTALKKIVDIGVNVQAGPGKAADNTRFPFTSTLAATPDQDTGVVAGQTLVRAVEIDLVGGAVTVALANAAAGPSSAAPTSAAPVPNAVDAGRARTDQGTPALPVLLTLLALVIAGGGALLARSRGRYAH